eukprot:6187284-Pleurochrysis_carterae.AAC.3
MSAAHVSPRALTRPILSASIDLADWPRRKYAEKMLQLHRATLAKRTVPREHSVDSNDAECPSSAPSQAAIKTPDQAFCSCFPAWCDSPTGHNR